MRTDRRRLFLILLFAALALCGQPRLTLSAQGGADALERGFDDPPASARPRVWWHWMNGNITKEGIQRDLEWMQRVGIAGFQNFDAALSRDQVVDKRLVYMTPEWQDAFRFATDLADRLGLEEAIAGSPGWSESGGPWVTPAQGMKKLVWSTTQVAGGRPFTGTLAKPPSTTGPFQNVPLFDFISALSGQPQPHSLELYHDVAVIGYRVPSGDVPIATLHPTVTSSGGSIDAAALADGDFVKGVSLPIPAAGDAAWIQFEFPQAVSIRGISVAMSGFKWPFGPPPPGADLMAGDDGGSLKKVTTVDRSSAEQNTVSFPAVRARVFRVTFPTPPKPDFGLGDSMPTPPPAKTHEIAELVLHTGARVNRFEEKAAFVPFPDLTQLATPPVAATDAIRKSDIVDLTAKLRPDGTLDWTPPEGEWTVLRFGYSLLGITNHPASPEGTGLEVDKLNPGHVKAYMTTYLDSYQKTLGPLMGARGLRYMISDSWEAGAQNWTDDMIAEFTRRRGYDPRPWLPAMTGAVIESAEATDRFLWDFRRALSDMLTEYHYDQITTLLKERGLGHYGESHESGRAFIGDGMEVKRTNDIPMAAMWTQRPGVNDDLPGANADIRESASVAHIYGQNLVAAESMTAATNPWAWSPETLKPTADKELAMGLNRFVIHTSVHQPLTDKGPGLSLGPFGQWFTRNETWGELAKPWIQYLGRSSFLLQQGRFVADIAYYYGEDSNVTALFQQKAPAIPDGYNYDFVNADIVVHRLAVKDGQLSTQSGMRYRVLALDPHSRWMSLPVLKAIASLVQAGAIVVGPKPLGTPSLSDDDTEYRRVLGELWGTGDGGGEHRHGAGVVHGNASLEDVLAAMSVPADFTYTKPRADTNLLFVHRALDEGDIYFVDNRRDRDEDLEATFRVTGRQAELWHPDTGKREPAAYRPDGQRTAVSLHLAPWETVFVVFRRPSSQPPATSAASVQTELGAIDGPWTVSFQMGRGAPASAKFATLTSWAESSDPGIKYFSGTASYTATVDAPAGWFKPGASQWIDLGDVKNLAEVTVNGKPLGLVWKRPFKLEATGILKPGANQIEVKVTNLWVNRMIGDRQPAAATKYTFTSPTFYKADSPLLPSGLLGPVRVLQLAPQGSGGASSR